MNSFPHQAIIYLDNNYIYLFIIYYIKLICHSVIKRNNLKILKSNLKHTLIKLRKINNQLGKKKKNYPSYIR